MSDLVSASFRASSQTVAGDVGFQSERSGAACWNRWPCHFGHELSYLGEACSSWPINSLEDSSIIDARVPCCVWVLGHAAADFVTKGLVAPVPAPFFVSDPVNSDSVWMHSALEWIEHQLRAFYRSLLLFYFFAVLHAFAKATPLTARSRRKNAVIRGTRSAFRGAPVVLACLWLLHMPLPVQSVRSGLGRVGDSASVDLPGDEPQPRVAEALNVVALESASVTHEVAFACSDLQSGSLTSPGTGAAGAGSLEQAPPTNMDSAGAVEAFVPDPEVWIGVYKIQVSPHMLKLALVDGDDVGCLLSRVEEESDCGVWPVRAWPVEPQPVLDHLACLAVPLGLGKPGFVPVMIHIAGQCISPYAALLPQQLELEHVIIELGPLWLPCFGAFVGDAVRPMDKYARLHVAPGTLITIAPWDSEVVAKCDFKNCLQRVMQGLLAFSDWPSEDQLERTFVGIVGRFGDWNVQPDNELWSTARLQRLCAARSGLNFADLRACNPCSMPRDLWFRGLPVTRLIGFDLLEETSTCAFFLDARKLHCPVQLLCLPPEPVQIGKILEDIGAGIFQPSQLVAHGAPFYTNSSGAFIPASAALVTVEPAPIPLPCSDRAADDRTAACAGVMRSDADVAPEAEGAAAPLQGHGFDTALELDGQSTPDTTWNQALMSQDAHLLCRHGDTSGLEVESQATAAKAHLHLDACLLQPKPEARGSGVVECVAPVWLVDLSPPTEESGGGESSDPFDDSVSLATEAAGPDSWCILVKALSYQQHAQFLHVRVERGESVTRLNLCCGAR